MGKRPPGKRPQRQPVQLLEQLPPAFPQMRHNTIVQFLKAGPESLVDLFETEESAVAQRRQDALLDHLDHRFHFGLVFRVVDPGRQHRCPIMHGQRLIGRVELRLIKTGRSHPGFRVVGDHDFHNAAKVLKRSHVTADPVRKRLRSLRLRVSGRACSQGRHEKGTMAGRLHHGLVPRQPVGPALERYALAHAARVRYDGLCVTPGSSAETSAESFS